MMNTDHLQHPLILLIGGEYGDRGRHELGHRNALHVLSRRYAAYQNLLCRRDGKV